MHLHSLVIIVGDFEPYLYVRIQHLSMISCLTVGFNVQLYLLFNFFAIISLFFLVRFNMSSFIQLDNCP